MPAVVWNIESPVLAGAATTGGVIGWLIVLYSTFLISHFELFGLTQVIDHFIGRLDYGFGHGQRILRVESSDRDCQIAT